MGTDKHTRTPMGGRLLICALGASLVALVVYALSLAGYLMPGDATHLFTQWSGLDALPLPEHPIWGALVKAVGGWSFPSNMATRMNLVSLICGTLSAGLLCYLMGFFVQRTVRQEHAVPFTRGAAMTAGLAAAFAFIFSTAVWQSSIILDYRIFDVCLALVLFTCLVPMATCEKTGALLLWTSLLGVGVAIGLVESAIFVPLAPLYLLALIVTVVKTGKRPYLSAALFLGVFFIAYLVVFNIVAANFLELPSAKAGGFTSAGGVWAKCASAYAHEIRTWFSSYVPGYPPDLRKMWLVVLVFSVLPFVACMFAAPRGLNNERTWSQYLFHLAMTLCVIIGIATPASPEGLLRRFGISPVATTTLVAAACGYLAAYWYMLARIPARVTENVDPEPAAVIGRRVAPAVFGVLAALTALAALVNGFTCTRDRGSYASVCANAILDRMGSRTWLVTSGLLDDHIRAAAATRKMDVNLICLHRDSDDAYLRELTELVKEKKPDGGGADLTMSAQLGVLPFIQDWFAGDTNITREVAVVGVPDFWYMARAQPVSQDLIFGGVTDIKTLNAQKLNDDFLAFWAKIEPVLFCEKGKGSRAIVEALPSDALRLELRRHVGFVANNLAVTLQDLKQDKLAWNIYELVLKTIDPDNICALFNEFEMARAGVPEAVAHQREIERQLKAIVDDPNRRYALWSLSRYYGYIRSAEMFARMGFNWARSALPGIAIELTSRGTDLVPANRQDGLLLQMAMAYASGHQTAKSRETYEKILKNDTFNHEARMGLATLALANGEIDEAKRQLMQAVKKGKGGDGAGFDWALLHMLNHDLDKARMTLQKMTDLQPKSLQAWALLAGVLLQRFDEAKDPAAQKKVLDELDTVILPKMQVQAEGPHDYFVQTTRALVLLRKADLAKDKNDSQRFRREARDAFIVASGTRPDVSAVGDMVLNLDISLDDTENAERHARQVLRQDRRSKLANYVMGSIRLKNGEYVQAENFLRLSVEAEKPIAAAQNDLAETLRRRGNYEAAERYAHAATVTQPDLYVAWETLGSALLDQKKNLDEAETCVKKAISIAKEKLKLDDPRMLITLARVQIARKDTAHANATLRTLRSRQKELSGYDLETLEKLQKSAMAR